MHATQKILKIYLKYSFYIHGLHSISRLPWLTGLIRTCTLSWLVSAVFLMFYWHINGGDTSIAALVGSASFVLNALVNIVIILETIAKSKYCEEMKRLQQEVNELLNEHLNLSVAKNIDCNYLSKRLVLILICQFVCDGLKIWINRISNIISPVFWYLLPISVSLRTRYIQIINEIMIVNRRSLMLRDAMWLTINTNEPKSIYGNDIWRAYDPKDYEKVNLMRLIYLRMWQIYMVLNDLYGWSLLALCMSSFFDIVCNCYWTYAAVYEQQVFHKYVMNGATSFAWASLMFLLFYYTDGSERNRSFDMALHTFKITISYDQSKAYKASILFMYLGFWLFGLSPCTNNYRVYQGFVVVWCCEIAITTYLAIICEVFGNEQSLNRLVSIILYITHMLGHLVVLIESCGMYQYRFVLFKQLSAIRKEMVENVRENENQHFSAIRLSRMVIVILVLLSCGHGLVMWTTFRTKSAATLLYWWSLQSYLALQFKTLDFLIGLLQFLYYISKIRHSLNDMGERNLKSVFKHLPKSSKSKITFVVPHNEAENDKQLLEILKKTYNDVYAAFQVFNQSYGWSLLSSTAVYFVDFVSNSYWIFLALLTPERDFYGLLQNISFALMAFVLLSIICWFAQECHYESRYIGCLISKLAKPLGNKHYNDLVREFSIQTLHQRFIITAKEFFNLNLSLLGRMVAAIVTYLVILIQFMFTEKTIARTSWNGISIFTNATANNSFKM